VMMMAVCGVLVLRGCSDEGCCDVEDVEGMQC
jgi:hypothetical protein